MDLRDLTRESEQSRRAIAREVHRDQAQLLEVEQLELVQRTEAVIEEIEALPNGKLEFARELTRLGNAVTAMSDAEARLAEPTTGPVTVAAETEAIEHLLEARRAGGSGGGGGSTPGGGLKAGRTSASALALAGRMEDALGQVGERGVLAAAGPSEAEPPSELRATLDRYFEALNGK